MGKSKKRRIEENALGGGRTHNPSLRRAVLYPVELQAHEIRLPLIMDGAEGEI